MEIILISIAIISIYIFILIKQIQYYRKGWGLNFHLLDLKHQDGWVKPYPTKFERGWPLITIIAETTLLLAVATLFVI